MLLPIVTSTRSSEQELQTPSWWPVLGEANPLWCAPTCYRKCYGLWRTYLCFHQSVRWCVNASKYSRIRFTQILSFYGGN